MGDIFGIIPDAKPPKGKEGHIQDIFGTWVEPNKPRPEPSYTHQPKRPKHKTQTSKQPEQPKKRGYVTESYVQTGKDIIKGVRYGIKGARYLNKLRKEHKVKSEELKEFKQPERARDKPFKIKQDY